MKGIIEVYNADNQQMEELELVPTPEITEPVDDGETYNRKAGQWVKSVGQIDKTPDAASHGEVFNDYTNNKAIGENSHVEGSNNIAKGEHSHAEGYNTEAGGNFGSHSEGSVTKASGASSHAEGYYSEAIGENSHAEGQNTISDNCSQHSQGQYNTKEQTPSPKSFDLTKTLFSIGNGINDENRSDALKMLGDGTTWIGGIGDFNGTNPTESNSLQAELHSKGDKVDEVSINDANVTQTLEPNKLYKFGSLTDLNITLGTPVSGIANVFACQFTSGDPATRLVVPSTIVWAETKATDKGAPKISANKSYEISIVNNKGIIGEF